MAIPALISSEVLECSSASSSVIFSGFGVSEDFCDFTVSCSLLISLIIELKFFLHNLMSVKWICHKFKLIKLSIHFCCHFFHHSLSYFVGTKPTSTKTETPQFHLAPFPLSIARSHGPHRSVKAALHSAKAVLDPHRSVKAAARPSPLCQGSARPSSLSPCCGFSKRS
eukprot:g11931.t1